MKTKKWISVIIGASLLGACADKEEGQDKRLSAETFKPVENRPVAKFSEREADIIKQAMAFGFSTFFLLYREEAPEHSLPAIRQTATKAIELMYDKENNLSEIVDDTSKCASGGTLVTKGSASAKSDKGSPVRFATQASGTLTLSSCGGTFFDENIAPITGELRANATFIGSVQGPASENKKERIDSQVLNMLDGSFSGAMSGSPYKVILKNFGVAVEIRSDKMDELKQIEMDLLGQGEQIERRRDFMKSILKCTGSAVIEGKEYECGQIINWVIEKSLQ